MWEKIKENVYRLHCRDENGCCIIGVDICSKCRKDVENGREVQWVMWLIFYETRYSCVQFDRSFVGTVEQAKTHAENYLRKLKEVIPL